MKREPESTCRVRVLFSRVVHYVSNSLELIIYYYVVPDKVLKVDMWRHLGNIRLILVV